MSQKELSASAAGDLLLGGKIFVHRLGFGAMRLTGEDIWGPPKDRNVALAVLRRPVELGVNFIDTADRFTGHHPPRLLKAGMRRRASATRQPQAIPQGGEEAECLGVPQHAVPPNPLASECENH